MSKQKNLSISLLKCIATLLITNSHLSKLYPAKLSALSFGGLFGNCIFFFVSGYCLTQIVLPFGKWMAKRFVRIYLPYIIFLPFLLFSGYVFSPLWHIIFPIEPYHFLPSIITLYPIFYLASYLNKNTKIKYEIFFVLSILIQLGWFLFAFDINAGDITQHYSVIGLSSYFSAMVGGAIVKEKTIECKPLIALVMSMFCFALYFLQSVKHFEGILRILQWELAIAFTLSFGIFVISIRDTLKENKLVDLMAGLTLEIYLVQGIAISAYSNTPFPTGIIYCLISIVGVAYVLHYVSNLILSKKKE